MCTCIRSRKHALISPLATRVCLVAFFVSGESREGHHLGCRGDYSARDFPTVPTRKYQSSLGLYWRCRRSTVTSSRCDFRRSENIEPDCVARVFSSVLNRLIAECLCCVVYEPISLDTQRSKHMPRSSDFSVFCNWEKSLRGGVAPESGFAGRAA